MYVDIVFVLTYLLHYLLIVLTNHVSGTHMKRVRLHVFTCLLSLINILPVLIDFSHEQILQFTFSIISLSCLYYSQDKYVIIKRLVIFTILTSFFAGTFFLLKTHVTLNVPFMLLLAVISYHFYLRFYQSGVTRQLSKNQLYDVSVTLNDKTVCLTAFFDTGHQLSDPLTNESVLFIDQSIYDMLEDDEHKKSEKRLYYQDINANVHHINCIKPDYVTVNNDGQTKQVSHVLLAVRRTNERKEEFQALFGPQFLTLLKSI